MQLLAAEGAVEGRRQRAHRLQQRPPAIDQDVHPMFVVAAEILVASVAAQRDRDVLAGEPREQERRQLPSCLA